MSPLESIGASVVIFAVIWVMHAIPEVLTRLILGL